MAQRRMFAKTIIDSDAFLDMPLSSQALYFHLNMRADDDGFINNPKKIMRMIGASDDDIKVLFAKKFIIGFESGVIVIKHWRMHNYIRKDRKHDTVYADEYLQLTEKENGAYTLTGNTSDPKLLDDNGDETLRQKAYRESELPYSFSYKIRQAFWDKICPVCGKRMTSNYLCKPTIQHNIPISKGGKHELGNISVICQSCNASIKDNPTGKLNADEVIRVWDEICQPSDGQLTDSCHVEDRIGKDRLDKNKYNTSDCASDDSKNDLSEEFNALWDIYPKGRKQGKKRAMEAYKRTRKKGTSFEEVKEGIESYVSYIARNRIETQFIKQASTFFSQEAWMDDWSQGVAQDDDLDGIL